MNDSRSALRSIDVGVGAPIIEQQSAHYTLRMATSKADMQAVFKLRFQVFNLELDEGLASSYATGLDQDEFDPHCDHLIVEDTRSGDIVGTYRMQDFTMAQRGAGFYSASEFVLDELPDHVLNHSIELGRACIDAEHRNTRVLFLLWRGLAAYMLAGGHRYFFGCCSLTSRDANEGKALYKKLIEQDMLDPTLCVSVQPDYRCVSGDPAPSSPPRIPKLMRLYLSYGARIISGPAIDRAFSTIDFLALFDLDSLSEQARRMFIDD